MAKTQAKVNDVLATSKEILASNNGKMTYQDWQAALTEKVGEHDNALKHILKNKLIFLWLEGWDANMKPQMWVVNDKSLIVDTKPLTSSKIGEAK